MKKYLFVILLSLSSSIFGQDISVETQKYYVLANEWESDSVCNLIYTVKNVSSSPQVVLLTEDDVNSMPYYHHLVYPYSSITLSWNQIIHRLDKQNKQSWSTYELVGCQVQIKVNPSHVQKINDGHGPSYALTTSKGYFVISDAANTEFDFDEYEIIKTDTINGIYSTYGVHNDKFYRKDSRPIGNKSRCLIYYANVMAKDTCEFNRIMDNVIVVPR